MGKTAGSIGLNIWGAAGDDVYAIRAGLGYGQRQWEDSRWAWKSMLFYIFSGLKCVFFSACPVRSHMMKGDLRESYQVYLFFKMKTQCIYQFDILE